MPRAMRSIAAAGLLAFIAADAAAQTRAATDVRLLVTVVDQTRAVIPAATVTVTGLDEATKIAIAPTKTSDQGVATLTSLAQGRYTIQAEFPGFETGVLKEIRLRGGDNRHVIVLAIQ